MVRIELCHHRVINGGDITFCGPRSTRCRTLSQGGGFHHLSQCIERAGSIAPKMINRKHHNHTTISDTPTMPSSRFTTACSGAFNQARCRYPKSRFQLPFQTGIGRIRLHHDRHNIMPVSIILVNG